ncbi:unnamed protein product [Rhizoctonia solani]|uniref:Uncharacterized protein n=3 Tax=Rhizoctonia solani TaxID=456999 RepID=A0A8H3DUM3_9AGAM|nr:hypothetical protein RSOL_506250 [Rhizoctonia solani AG-3 Rhs1AP]KEP50915.1 hypothetical protein V565_070950 [Rhizoctonia solani 123E]CAE6487844.1 unnamed protein product [Rhizoctonia solani]CAE6538544.1 unnamed protein product [Rhizoctonia solani]
MSRPSASMSTVKGFSLTFNDLAAFTNHILYSPPSPSTPVRDTPKVNEGRRPNHDRVAIAFQLDQQQPRHRHSASSTSSVRSWRSSSSHASRPPNPPHSRTDSWAPTSPKFVDHPPRRLTERERATLANYTEPEMDIADMVGMCRDQGMGFEPLQ